MYAVWDDLELRDHSHNHTHPQCILFKSIEP